MKNTYWKINLNIARIFLFVCVLSESSYSQQPNREIFVMAEVMPRFPGCEMLANRIEKEKCANQKLMEYIYSNIQYPSQAIKNNIEGRVTVRFVVNQDSSVSNIEILKDIGGGCGEVVKKVIESMNSMSAKWLPGMQGGRKVDIYFTLPVIFKLNSDAINFENSINKFQTFIFDADTIFLKNEEVPLFPGKNERPENPYDYNDSKLNEYVKSNLKIPDEVFMRNLSGEVLVEFTITKKGIIKDIKILKDIGFGSGEEVVRLIKSINNLQEKWIPAKYDGKSVNSTIKYSIKFPKPDEKVKINQTHVKDSGSGSDSNSGISSDCDDSPVFPTCTELPTRKEMAECSKFEIMNYIFQNLKYPPAAKKIGLEGRVLLRFTVNTNGIVDNVVIIKDIGGGCGDEAKRVILSTNNLTHKWLPGIKNGNKTDSNLTVPVIFKL